jgi:small-conductance mechanosensitive channel
VYRIDFLTTTIWEIGAPYRQGFVQAEQPTGRLVTFPNNEVLTGTVVNLTKDFPYVWDEMSVAVANESDLRLALKVLQKIARDLLGNYMAEPSRQYAALLQKAGLEDFIHPEPQVFVSSNDSWTDLTIRYLVGARERRKWKSELTLLVTEELNKKEYSKTVIQVYPRQQLQFIRQDGIPAKLDDFQMP